MQYLYIHISDLFLTDFSFQNLYKTDVLLIENHVSDHINCWCMIPSPGDKDGNGFSCQESLSSHPVIHIFNSQSAVIFCWTFWIILFDQQVIFKLKKKWKNEKKKKKKKTLKKVTNKLISNLLIITVTVDSLGCLQVEITYFRSHTWWGQQLKS